MWFGSHILKKNKTVIENIQRRGTRLIPELKGLSYTQRLQELKLFSLDYRRKRGDKIQLFKILNIIDNINPESMFKLSTSDTRGHNRKLYKHNVTKDSDSTLFVFALLILGINCRRKRWILKIWRNLKLAWILNGNTIGTTWTGYTRAYRGDMWREQSNIMSNNNYRKSTTP